MFDSEWMLKKAARASCRVDHRPIQLCIVRPIRLTRFFHEPVGSHAGSRCASAKEFGNDLCNFMRLVGLLPKQSSGELFHCCSSVKKCNKVLTSSGAPNMASSAIKKSNTTTNNTPDSTKITKHSLQYWIRKP